MRIPIELAVWVDECTGLTGLKTHHVSFQVSLTTQLDGKTTTFSSQFHGYDSIRELDDTIFDAMCKLSDKPCKMMEEE